MRRTDREVTDNQIITQIISSCNCIRIGFIDEGQVYIVPLNYGYTVIDGKYVFYFHGAKEGRKIELIHKNPYVGFEMDTNVKIIESDTACKHSAYYSSIIGNGYISIVDDPTEKKTALLTIMKHNTGKNQWTFSDAAVNSVCIFKIVVNQLSCKEHG